ncbi:hypothetical protein V5O48_017927 [Marasmius crinis-equi]|uniref:Uncharacterized protein n=1 Tax=Marasmius crinis-equi TaxID=585013 RepID=A0ABR3EMM0_9AGAR
MHGLFVTVLLASIVVAAPVPSEADALYNRAYNKRSDASAEVVKRGSETNDVDSVFQCTARDLEERDVFEATPEILKRVCYKKRDSETNDVDSVFQCTARDIEERDVELD